MVCVGPSPFSQKLIRSTRQLANNLDVEWIAAYVAMPGHARINEDIQDQITNNLALAQQLGAKVVTLSGSNVAKTLIDYATTHHVTKVIVGKPLQFSWLDLIRGSLVDRLVRISGDIDIYIINSDTEIIHKASPKDKEYTQNHVQNLLLALGLVGSTTLVGLIIHSFLSPANLVMLYLVAVLIAAVRFGRSVSNIVAVTSVVAFNFFFVPPRFTFVVSDAEYLFTFAGLLIVGLVITGLTSRVSEHARTVEHRERQTTALYALSRDLSASIDLEDVIQHILHHFSTSFSCEIAIYLPNENELELKAITPDFPQSSSELQMARWVYQNERLPGKFIDSPPSRQVHYIPLRTAQNQVGVIGIKFNADDPMLSPERQRLLAAFANQAALGINATILAEQARQSALLKETERLQAALLNSISHDLRTPLVSITGALSSLKDQAGYLTEQTRNELIAGAWEESERLNRLVGNLLDMTRLESGSLPLKKSPSNVQEMVGVALKRLDEMMQRYDIQIDIPANLPLVDADFVLIVQVLVNLLDNAAKYSPEGSTICIQASVDDTVEDMVNVKVSDQGVGIQSADLTKIFNKFYRGENVREQGGTGLGLSICQGIVEAHGGEIRAENRSNGGTSFAFSLPLALVGEEIMEMLPHESE